MCQKHWHLELSALRAELHQMHRPLLLHGAALCICVETVAAWNLNLFSQQQQELAPEAATDSRWKRCAVEGQVLSNSGHVRFGWGDSWVSQVVHSGMPCSVSSFAADPIPYTVKICECDAQVQLLSDVGATQVDKVDSATHMDFGVAWTRCAKEDEQCNCKSGKVRFGQGDRWVHTQLQGSSTVQCNMKSLGVPDPLWRVRKECFCQSSEAGPARAKVAIALMSHEPVDISTWLRYHLLYMGLEHVFLQLEQTPEFDASFAKLPESIKGKITLLQPSSAWGHGPPQDNYKTLQGRQISLMSTAQKVAANMGMDWLVHVDDDELLYSNSGRHLGDVLAAMPLEIRQLHLPNEEAIYPSPEVQSCFLETSEVLTSKTKYASYANGKAAIRLLYQKELTPAGPHMWATLDGRLPTTIDLNKETFGSPLTVLHYESCPFKRWEDKFVGLAKTTQDLIATMPFPFYQESIELIQKCSRSGGNSSSAVFLEIPQCQKSDMVNLWSNWKTFKNPNLNKQDLMPIQIPWAEIMQMS